jgi:hypothetical protein
VALPEQDEVYLQEKQYHWELIPDAGEQLLIVRGYELPAGKYTPSVVDLLIRIPAGYPAHNPDMFFIVQVVQRVDGTAPTAVTPTTINGATWHQWSRHYPPGLWRPGIDGLETYLHAIRTELEKGK